MLDYIFILYGIDHKYKTLNKLFTGLIITTYSVLIITTLLTINFVENKFEFIFKILCIIFWMTSLYSYVLIKLNSELLLEIIEELNEFYIKFNIRKSNISSIIYIILHLILYFLILYSSFNDNIIDESVKWYFVNISFHHHATITVFYLNGWLIMLQFIYYEISNQYLEVLNNLNEKMKNIQKTPNCSFIYDIRKTIEHFLDNEIVLKKVIYNKIYFIFLMNISYLSTNMFYIYSAFVKNDLFLFILFLTIFIIILIYFISKQIILCLKSNVKKKIIENLKQWKNSIECRKY